MVNLQSDVATDRPATGDEETAEDDDDDGAEDGGETDHQDDMSS